MRKLIVLSLFSCLLATRSIAQDTTDVMSKLENDVSKTNYTTATFKSTRVINGHSVDNIPKGVLDVRILHRFAPLNTGIYNFFGIDQASMRLGFDYGITNRFMIGIGHSTWQKTYDGFLKYKILRQSSGAVNMPITMAFITGLAIRSDHVGRDSLNRPINTRFSDKTNYFFQFIIGRKFSKNFSLQIMPIYILNHNKIDNIRVLTKDRFNVIRGEDRKDAFAIGMAGRLKVSKRIALTAEYYYQLPDSKPDHRYNSIAFGVDIETGGHVFQLHFTNSNGMTESSFINDTDDKWTHGAIRFGFNLSRVFNIGKH